MQNMTLEQTKEKCETVAAILKTLANPQRLMILCNLVEGEKSVGELQKICGISQSVISQHLARMRLQGFLASKKEQNFVFYRICDERILKVMENLYDIFCSEE